MRFSTFKYFFLLAAICFLHPTMSAQDRNVVSMGGQHYIVHTVKKGDTVYSLGKSYGVPLDVIYNLNPKAKNGIRVGEYLRFPFKAEQTLDKKKKKYPKKVFLRHEVSLGENLYSIAKSYGISVDILLDDNPSLDPTSVRQGMMLYIRRQSQGTATEDEIAGAISGRVSMIGSFSDGGHTLYMAKTGDTLYSISKQFGISVTELLSLNCLGQDYILRTGDVLKVPSLKKDQDSQKSNQKKHISWQTVQKSKSVKISLLLPLGKPGSANRNFVDFYEGFLLGLEHVASREGHSAFLTVFNTTTQSISSIAQDPVLCASSLIVGPIYEKAVSEMVKVADSLAIPLVTPLAQMKTVSSSMVYQMAPLELGRITKLGEFLNESSDICFVTSSQTDVAFKNEILSMLKNRHPKTFHYEYEHPSVIEKRQKAQENYISPSDLSPVIAGTGKRTVVVLANNETDVDRIIAALSSARKNLRARSQSVVDITVVGSAKWTHYRNIDPTLFFETNVRIVSSYCASGVDERVKEMNRCYVESFSHMPSLYSYRGYDAACIFLEAMYHSPKEMMGRVHTPLQQGYFFEKQTNGLNVNTKWSLVEYGDDFSIKTR